jgi:hypothetical protein
MAVLAGLLRLLLVLLAIEQRRLVVFVLVIVMTWQLPLVQLQMLR